MHRLGFLSTTKIHHFCHPKEGIYIFFFKLFKLFVLIVFKHLCPIYLIPCTTRLTQITYIDETRDLPVLGSGHLIQAGGRGLFGGSKK